MKLTEEISKWYPKKESGYLKRVPLYYQKGDGAKVLQVSFIPHKNVEAKEEKPAHTKASLPTGRQAAGKKDDKKTKSKPKLKKK